MEVDVEDFTDETHLWNAIVPYIQMVSHKYNMHCVHMGTLQNLDSGLWTGPWTGLWTGLD